MKETLEIGLILARNEKMTTERLELRPVHLSDAKDLYEYGSDEETTRYVFPTHQTIEETDTSIANYFMATPLGKWAIVWKETQKMIGTIDLRVDASNRVGEIGYILNKAYWGQGIVPEGCKKILRLSFVELELLRVCGYHDSRNPNSGKVMKKIGMTHEASIPNHSIHKGVSITMEQYGITNEKYLSIFSEKS